MNSFFTFSYAEYGDSNLMENVIVKILIDKLHKVWQVFFEMSCNTKWLSFT
jgi:hypothetical protein